MPDLIEPPAGLGRRALTRVLAYPATLTYVLVVGGVLLLAALASRWTP